MLTFIVLVVIAGWLIAIWYEWWQVKAYSEFSEKSSNSINEIEFLKEQIDKISKERRWEQHALAQSLGDLHDEQVKNKNLINENDVLTNKLTQYMLRYGELKQTIEMEHQEEIIQYFNEWLSYKAIAEKIGCGASTIQRAVKKRWLVR